MWSLYVLAELSKSLLVILMHLLKMIRVLGNQFA